MRSLLADFRTPCAFVGVIFIIIIYRTRQRVQFGLSAKTVSVYVSRIIGIHDAYDIYRNLSHTGYLRMGGYRVFR